MMPRTLVLALCLFAAVCTASAALPPAPSCDGAAARPGGWSPTSQVPDEVFSAIQVALVEGGNSTLSFCDDPTPTTLAACSQVVAGSNYEVIAELSCPEVKSSVEIYAQVFIPLPSSNEEPEVTSLDILSIDTQA